jgi:NAD(P)-dependent dehydrogenase (short-subunit alcohol dehydrogenase family)
MAATYVGFDDGVDTFHTPAMQPRGTAVVTGASRGIGRAIAIDLAQAGFDVVATMRDPDAGKGLVDEVGVTTGSITIQRLDVNDPAGIVLPDDIRVLVNNAGIERDYLPVEHTPREHWRDVFETNVFGLVEVTRRAVPLMRTNGGGVICNITSSSILAPMPFYAVYRASKAAVSALDDTLRVELAPFGIRVVEIMPGPVESDMLFASERIAEAAQHEEYRAMAEGVYEGRMQITDQYTPASVAAEMIRTAILDDDGPMRYGCDPMSVGLIEMWRGSSDEGLFTAMTGQG